MSVAANPFESNRTRNGRPKRLSILLLLGLASAGCIPVARAVLYETDHQFANLAGIGLGMLASLLIYAGLWRMLGRSINSHLIFLTLPVVALIAFTSMFKFVGFTGETLPVFRSRWSTPLPTASAGQDSSDISALDVRSTQFLGNDRSGVVLSERFDTKWDKRAPKVLWKKAIGAGWSGFSVSQGLAITLEQIDEQESVSAYRLSDGSEVWKAKFPGKHFQTMGGTGPRSTPTIRDDRVVAQTASGIVACLTLQTGEILWQQDLNALANTDQAGSEQAIAWGRSGSPLIIEQTVVVPFGGKLNDPQVKSLVALDLLTGKVQWTGGKTQIAYASPMLLTIQGVQQIVSVNEGNATGHDPSNGNVLWETPWPSKSNGDACASQPVIIDDRRILLGKGYALGSKMIQLVKVEGKSQSEAEGWAVETLWSNTKVLKTKFTNAVLFEGSLFALSDGVLECVDPATGERRWRGGRYGQGQLIIVNGHILITTEDGRIVLLPASSEPTSGGKGPKEILQVPVLEGITWNVPTVAGPYLLVRNGEQVACLLSEKGMESDEPSSQPRSE